jgi:predicted GNAT family N-acyltransferase
MNFKIATTPIEREQAYFIRKKVFVDEQKVPLEEEIDQYEDEATHFVLYTDDLASPIGAGRFRVIDGLGKVERICVLRESRQKGSGAALMNGIEDYAQKKQIKKLKLNAQTQAIPFYQKLGYQTVSEEFLDAGIPHKTMIKEL